MWLSAVTCHGNPEIPVLSPETLRRLLCLDGTAALPQEHPHVTSPEGLNEVSEELSDHKGITSAGKLPAEMTGNVRQQGQSWFKDFPKS